MGKKITLEHVGYKDTYKKCTNRVAYKDGKMYDVFISSKSCEFGGCLGRVLAVIVDGEAVAWQFPLHFCSNDYEIISRHKINQYKNIVTAYDEYMTQVD